MRKTASILAAALLAIAPASALADTLTIDLGASDYDALAAARDQITARMDELLAAQATPAPAEAADGMHYAGDGTAIISDVQMPYDYNVIMYTAGSGTGYKIKGEDDKQLAYALNGQKCDIVTGPRTCKLLVEGQTPWTLDITPLATTSTLPTAEGIGCYASPIFTLPTDTIVNLHITDPDGRRDILDTLSTNVTLYALMADGRLRSDALVIGGGLTDNAVYDADLILSPVSGATGYVLVINCLPEYQWTVTPK